MKITNIRSAIYFLLIKLSGSRKSFYNLLGKIESWLLIIFLTFNFLPSKAINYILIIYFVEQLRTLIYMGLIQFDKVQTSIKINK